MSKFNLESIKGILKTAYGISDTDINCYLEILRKGGTYKGDLLRNNNCDEEVIKRLEDSKLIQKFPETGTLYIPVPLQEVALEVIDGIVDTLIQVQKIRSESMLREINGVLIFSEQRKSTRKNLSATIVRDIIKNVSPGTKLRLRVRKLSTFAPDIYPDFIDHIIDKDLKVEVLLVSEKQTPYEIGIKRAREILSTLEEKDTVNLNRFQVRISNRKSEHLRYLLVGNIVMFVVGTSPVHTGIIIEDRQISNIFKSDFDSEFNKAKPLENYLYTEINREL